MKPKVLIPFGVGINSHEELGKAFEVAGADVEFIILNELLRNPDLLDQVQGFGGPGGFMMGDQLGAGQSARNRIKYSDLNAKLGEKFDDPDFPAYIVCNFLQAVAKLDMGPVPMGTVANDSGKHETKCWDTAVNPNCDTVWLKYLKNYDGPVFAPISHGEGNIQMPADSLTRVQDENLVALTYEDGYMCEFLRSSRGHRYNPNGSVADIAGLGWSNNIMLFPHFERLQRDFQRPDRARVIEEKGNASGNYQPTYLMFKAAVELMQMQLK